VEASKRHWSRRSTQINADHIAEVLAAAEITSRSCAASSLSPLDASASWKCGRRQECRRGTQECVRHICQSANGRSFFC
jgi:hypothetical protein